MEKLFLLLSGSPDADAVQVSWYLKAGDKSARKPDNTTVDATAAGFGTIDDFIRIQNGGFSDREIVAIISGQYLTYTNVALAVKNQKQMLQALPFLVEEQVIGNIEDMHIAIPEKISGDSIRIAIIERNVLEKFKEFFLHHKLSVNKMFGLPDLLMSNADELRILISDDFAIVKSINDCFQCDATNLETMLELVSFDNISTVIIALNELNKPSLSLAKKIKNKFGSDLIKIKSSLFTEDMLGYIINESNADTSNCLNILQGDISLLNSRSKQLYKFLPLAWVAVLCLCLQISFNVASGFYFKRLSDNTNKDAVALYMRQFPEEKKVVNLAAQINAKINSSNLDSKSGKFPVVFAATVRAMNAVAPPKDIKIKQFRYDEQSGELKIGLDTSSIALLDKLKNKLEESNFVLDIISANEEGGIIKATVSIKNV